MDIRLPAGFLDLFLGRIRLREAQVLGDRRVEQVALLAHDSRVGDERVVVEVAHVGACELHGTS